MKNEQVSSLLAYRQILPLAIKQNSLKTVELVSKANKVIVPDCRSDTGAFLDGHSI